MSAKLAAFIMSSTFMIGTVLLLVSSIYEKKEQNTVIITEDDNIKKLKIHKKMTIYLTSGALLMIISLVIMINSIVAVRDPDTQTKSTENIVTSSEIIKIDSNNLYFKDGRTFRYTDNSRKIEVRENTSDCNFELVTKSTRHLLDTFIESYRTENKYIIYVDKETKETLEKIIENENIIWSKY